MDGKRKNRNINPNLNQRKPKTLKSQNTNQTLVGNSMRFRPVTPNQVVTTSIGNQLIVNNTGRLNLFTIPHIIEQQNENNFRRARMNNLITIGFQQDMN